MLRCQSPHQNQHHQTFPPMPRPQRLCQRQPNSLPARSSEPALPASAVEVPDQVMSEGASSAPDAAVRLSMKRSSDSSHSESEQRDSILITPRAMLSRFWTILTSVERLNSVVKSVFGDRRFLSM